MNTLEHLIRRILTEDLNAVITKYEAQLNRIVNFEKPFPLAAKQAIQFAMQPYPLNALGHIMEFHKEHGKLPINRETFEHFLHANIDRGGSANIIEDLFADLEPCPAKWADPDILIQAFIMNAKTQLEEAQAAFLTESKAHRQSVRPYEKKDFPSGKEATKVAQKMLAAITAIDAIKEDEDEPTANLLNDEEFEIAGGDHAGAEGSEHVSLRARPLSSVERVPVKWLWPDRIEAGKIAWFSGKPGCGKTLALHDLIARVTTGKDFPDGTENPQGARKVLLFVSEGSLSTAASRLMAVGADLDRIVVVDRVTVTDSNGSFDRPLRLETDLKWIKKIAKADPEFVMAAFDPISSYWGDEIDPNRDKDMRPFLDRISKMCDKTNVTFVGIIHNNKRGDVDAGGKIPGAGSILQACRSAWGFSADPDNKEEYLMSWIKCNEGSKRTGLRYKINAVPVKMSDGKEAAFPSVEWLGDTTEDADDVMAKERDNRYGKKENTKLALAKEVLEAQCATGAKLLKDIYTLAEVSYDISNETVKQARQELGYHVEKPPHSRGPYFVSKDATFPWSAAGTDEDKVTEEAISEW